MKMVRQGDLLIVETTAIPVESKAVPHRILAEGEATGHFHRLDSGQVYEQNGTLFFRVEESSISTLSHDEHGPIQFEPGCYKVIRQREYEPNGWRHVRD